MSGLRLFENKPRVPEDGSQVVEALPQRAPQAAGRDERFQDLKIDLHRRLIDTIDLAKLSTMETKSVEVQIRRALGRMVMSESTPLSLADRERLVTEVQHEVFGLGPLETLMADATISDILVNGHDNVYVERKGKLQKIQLRFRDDAHLMQIIDRIVSQVGRRIDESSPMVDARLADGSRVNAIIAPLALDGPVLSIRRFGEDPLTMLNLIANDSLPKEIAEVLEACVTSRLNIIISGGTGAGKTTLLNCLSNFIPHDERIVTIEDSAELKLQQDHVVRLETRPPNIEGSGTVTQRDLVRNALRMRPDRIVLGEVRGGECLDMVQAMNTGHDGSLSTVHANTARDALSRIETMMLMAGINLPAKALREQVAAAVDLIIQQSRMTDGTRKVTEVVEINGLEGDIITTQCIYKFNQTDIRDGKVIGEFQATGVRPSFLERVERNGIQLPFSYFMPASFSGGQRK